MSAHFEYICKERALCALISTSQNILLHGWLKLRCCDSITEIWLLLLCLLFRPFCVYIYICGRAVVVENWMKEATTAAINNENVSKSKGNISKIYYMYLVHTYTLLYQCVIIRDGCARCARSISRHLSSARWEGKWAREWEIKRQRKWEPCFWMT